MFDIVIYNGFHITMEGKGLGVIEEGGLAIQDGKVAAVGTAEEMRRADARRKIDASGMAVLPGLIDAQSTPASACCEAFLRTSAPGCSAGFGRFMMNWIGKVRRSAPALQFLRP